MGYVGLQHLMINTAQNKVIFFSPYAGIWQHSFPEALVVAALKRANSDTIYVTCDGIFSAGCIVMSAHGVNNNSAETERERVCIKCRHHRDLLVEHLNIKEVKIESLLDERALRDIKMTVLSMTPQMALEFEFGGLPLGRYALHETIIHFKLANLSELTPSAFTDFKRSFSHVLMTVYATKVLLDTYSPNQIVLYNTHISNNYALMNFAEKRGVPVYGLHAGGNIAKRLSSLYVFRRDMVVLYRHMIELFDSSLGETPSDEKGIKDAAAHFKGLASGTSIFVYSAPKHRDSFSVRDFFGIRRDQKILLATLSSYDELYSSQVMGVMGIYPLMFRDQVEWVSELITWAKNHADIFLLIRVHPREFPNRRDPLHSNHALRLAATFESLPPNVRINWPSDKVSLYDLATEVAVGLNGWSSTGKELALLGIPVVLFVEEILYYPASLNTLAKNKEDYFSSIDAMLKTGWTYKTMRQVFRWLAIEYTYSTIPIDDRFNMQEGAPRSIFRRLIGRLRRVIDPMHAERSDVLNLRRPLSKGNTFARAIVENIPVVEIQLEERETLTEIKEKLAIRSEIQGILDTVYRNNSTDSPLIKKLRAFVDNGDETSAPLFPQR